MYNIGRLPNEAVQQIKKQAKTLITQLDFAQLTTPLTQRVIFIYSHDNSNYYAVTSQNKQEVIKLQTLTKDNYFIDHLWHTDHQKICTSPLKH